LILALTCDFDRTLFTTLSMIKRAGKPLCWPSVEHAH
jgi:hypothetical protein